MMLNRGSHMSGHVLLDLFKGLGKNNKMRGLLGMLSLLSTNLIPSFAFKDSYQYRLVILITGVLIACLGMVLTHTTFNDKNENNKITFISH